jgi:hypothetical protein
MYKLFLTERRLPITLCILFIGLGMHGFLPAQSNALIDDFLAEESASFGKAVYFVMAASAIIAEDSSLEGAVNALEARGWLAKGKKPDESITLGEYSLLIMKAMDIRGGIMYRIFPRPRYAARELDYLGFIVGKSHPGRSISGEEALRMLGRILEWREERT